ncbi:hypothetical protein B296_00005892 [Ensete ventricosum]|uniref:Uncharacterized protein n=1 Tax=Ensete ventricosum TaxID=4639 RepID=A0A426YB27_ENSVE|nr:hypothetical protein B296_00005892 [Ensete ventricosum]
MALEFGAKIQTYPKNLITGGSYAGVGGLNPVTGGSYADAGSQTTRSTPESGYKRFNCRQPLENLDSDVTAKIKLGHRVGFERCSGISPKFAKRFTEGIGKLVGNTPGDRRKKTGGLTRKNAGGCRIGGRFGLHPKKIGSGRRCASRRRTREWT